MLTIEREEIPFIPVKIVINTQRDLAILRTILSRGEMTVPATLHNLPGVENCYAFTSTGERAYMRDLLSSLPME